MGWVLFAHICLPFLFGVAFVLFSAAASPHDPTWDIAIETSLDLAILGLGATGSVFENQTIIAVFGSHAAEVGIGVVAVNLILAAIIVLIKRYVFENTGHKLRWSAICLILGALALIVTSAVLAYSYSIGTPVGPPVGGGKPS